MPFVYHCNACREHGRRRSWGDARTDRRTHRQLAHPTLEPDDTIRWVPGLLTIALVWLTATRTGRRPAAERPRIGDHPAVRQAALVLGGGVIVILLLAALTR
ncbi:hypothetical protein [Streptomyces sp. B15]|uniref:hypothetical protein n=1 Tax=Streptomyces sp. B15 TaxID=1537797 RepID=UPI001B375BC9|nr:hypothetical protein [Streptomyces sp. B15]MBQ1122616.1 hypothetical protein [Streptomyces sp. B15]